MPYVFSYMKALNEFNKTFCSWNSFNSYLIYKFVFIIYKFRIKSYSFPTTCKSWKYPNDAQSGASCWGVSTSRVILGQKTWLYK